jgi:hypothetical protein
MATSITNRHRGLLSVLFFIFEALFVASVVILTRIDIREMTVWTEADGVAFWFSFVGLLVVSFLLRRTARHLAVIGWITLVVGFLFAAFLPAI